MPRHRARTATFFALVVTAALTALAVFQPAIVAIGCPPCFGFARLEANVFIDRDATPDERDEARAIADGALHKIGAFYGQQKSAPDLFLCTTAACYSRIGGGGSRGMAILDLALFLSPQGFTPVIATHELSHIELHKRLGRLKTLHRAIPQWFDEGVAIVVSEDPRYPLAQTGAECVAAFQGDMPVTRSAWIQEAEHGQLYAKAAQRVGCWMTARGGPPAIVDLIGKVAAGMSFEDAYR
jgi:hypothetical protein